MADTVNVPDLLGWICERAAGRRYAGLLSELLWQPMGAERPAAMTVDRLGAARSAARIRRDAAPKRARPTADQE